jgi:hypothetical protein
MWNKIVNLFSAKPTTTGSWKDQVLTAESPRLEPPAIPFAGKVELWAHQKAMLARCRWIEDHVTMAETRVMHQERYKKQEDKIWTDGLGPKPKSSVAIGLMNDPPGCGKTFAILALAAMDGDGKQTVVIVPTNIFAQWEAALATLYGPAGKEWAAPSFASITELYHRPKALDGHRILLLTDTLTDVFALAQDGRDSVHRVVIDEVDNIARRMTQPVTCKHIWFVSASFDPDDKETVASLPYEFDFEKSIAAVICSTASAFVTQSVKLPPPKLSTIVCNDSDVRLFEGLVEDAVLKSLHAGAVRPLLKALEIRGSEAPCLHGIAHKYVAFHEQQAAHTTGVLEDLLAAMSPGLEDQIAKFESLAKEHKANALAMSARLETYAAPVPGEDKWGRIDALIGQSMIGEPKSKWLIFNDDLDGLLAAQVLLKQRGVSCELLDGGSAKAIEQTLSRFKEQDAIQVLLINSKSEGCGLNLENATHLLFMHATDTALVEQIVGRAQRFGRKTALKIIGLLNVSEAGEGSPAPPLL